MSDVLLDVIRKRRSQIASDLVNGHRLMAVRTHISFDVVVGVGILLTGFGNFVLNHDGQPKSMLLLYFSLKALRFMAPCIGTVCLLSAYLRIVTFRPWLLRQFYELETKNAKGNNLLTELTSKIVINDNEIPVDDEIDNYGHTLGQDVDTSNRTIAHHHAEFYSLIANFLHDSYVDYRLVVKMVAYVFMLIITGAFYLFAWNLGYGGGLFSGLSPHSPMSSYIYYSSTLFLSAGNPEIHALLGNVASEAIVVALMAANFTVIFYCVQLFFSAMSAYRNGLKQSTRDYVEMHCGSMIRPVT